MDEEIRKQQSEELVKQAARLAAEAGEASNRLRKLLDELASVKATIEKQRR